MKQLQEKLELIEKQYVEAKKELNDKKKIEIAKILKDSANDPEELAEKLSQATGFQVRLPE